MDLSIKNMYDVFKDEIWKELGHLDPNWFEVLTAQASLDEENGADNDDLCANQEGNFKAPLEKTAAESQLFSTPKVFRHSRLMSPETEDEPSFTAAQEKEVLPWTATESPCLFQPSKQDEKCEGVQPQSEESFDLLDIPKTPARYAKHISESLGAQINPDISWTSSLNTPPALPSTLILSKMEESPCPVSVTADRNVVFVRKLFPSLSNSSLKTSKKSTVSSSCQDAVFPVADGCPESPLNQKEIHRQKVPDAVEGNYPKRASSNFFANSSSALRKVKPDRGKRKQINQTNIDSCSHEDVSKIDNGGSSEEAIADLESGGLPSTPLVKTGDTAISQWSPLSLSEISSCLAGSSQTLQDDAHSEQLIQPSLKTTDSGFIRKKRTFVYTVAATKLQVQDQKSEFQKMDLSPRISDSVNSKPLENTPGKAECCRTENQRKFVGETNAYSVVTKLQDIDMSQLCRDFAQDFSQTTHVKNAGDTQGIFSPAACLAVMKQAKQKTMQANLPNDYSGTSNSKHIPTGTHPSSISEGTMTDSGFQSDAANLSYMTSLSFGLPHLENTGQSRPSLGVKINMQHLPLTNSSGKAKLDPKVPLLKSGKRQTLDQGKDIELHVKSISSGQLCSREETVDENNSGQANKTPVSCPPQNPSGFKTASNKGIHISAAKLARAKRLFEEIEENKTSVDHSTKTYHAINDKHHLSPETIKTTPSTSNQTPIVGKSFGNISSQLTATEKADVTELCSLLEEADTQFEFTQFNPAKITHHPDDQHDPQKQDQDLDPAFLAEVDFDDSFSSDGEKHTAVAVMRDKMETTNTKILFTGTSVSDLPKKEISSLGSFSENISEHRKCLNLGEPNIFTTTGDTEANKLHSNSTLMLRCSFKTARGSVLKVSKECLSKARALFADLESNTTDQRPPGRQNRGIAAKAEQKCNLNSDIKEDSASLKKSSDVENKSEFCFSKLKGIVGSNKSLGVKDIESLENKKIDRVMCESGFRRANGKGISISAKYMKEADAFFKDCHIIGYKEEQNFRALPQSVENKRIISTIKSPLVSKQSVAGCTETETINAAQTTLHSKGPHLDEVQTKNGKPYATLRTSKSIDPPPFGELCSGNGSCTSAGKKVDVSAVSMKKAESVLNPIDTPEEMDKQPNQKRRTVKSKHLRNEMVNRDFNTASSAALKKGTLLRERENPEDNMCVSSQHTSPKIPVANSWSSGFFAASGKPVLISSEAFEKAKALFSDVQLNESDTAPLTKNKKHEQGQSDVTNTRGAQDYILVLKAKYPLKELDDLVLVEAMQEEDAVFTDCDLESNVAMLESRERNKEDPEKTYPDQRIRINISEEAEEECFMDTEEKKESILPQASFGFQTASGQRVDVSVEALKRAATLFGDFVEVKDKVKAVLPESKNIAPLIRDGGFCSASGKPVLLSSAALQKAESLFSDISPSADDPNMLQTSKNSKNEESNNNMGKICCGFTTASGEKVDVSQKNLQKAKVPFKELDDLVLTKAMQDADALFTDSDAGINDKMLEKDMRGTAHVWGSKKANLEKCPSVERLNVKISIEAGCSGEADKQIGKKENILPLGSCGFQTASGKRVDVSFEALNRAAALFGDCGDVEDKVKAGLPESKDIAPPIRDGRFRSASGKPVLLSSEALQKAKSLFSDISPSADDPNMSQTRKNSQEDDSCNNRRNICCGFTTAREEKVDVLQKNLNKAKVIFKEFDDLGLTKAMQDADALFKDCDGRINDGMLEKDMRGKAPVEAGGSGDADKQVVKKHNVLPQSSCGFQTASGKRVDVSSEALKRVEILFNEFEGIKDKVNTTPAQSKTTVPTPRNDGFCVTGGKAFSSEDSGFPQAGKTDGKQGNTEEVCCGFTTARGGKVSVSQNNLQKAKFLFKELDDLALTEAMQNTDDFFKEEGRTMDSNIKILPAQTKKAVDNEGGSIKEKISKADETETSSICEHSSIKAIQKEGISLSTLNSGFQTASGKKVAFSYAALSRAKLLLRENKAEEDKACVSLPLSEASCTEPGLTNCGFFSANGKPVPFDSEALQKAKTFFGNISLTAALPQKGEEKREGAHNKNQRIKCARLAPWGPKDQGSEKKLLKSGDLLREPAKGEGQYSFSKSINLQNPGNSDLKDLERILTPISSPTSGDKQNPSGVNSSPAADSSTDNHKEEKQCLLDCDLNTYNRIKGCEVMQTTFPSLYFPGCTETQNERFAQEALDCTKALLEDEVLVGQSLLATSEPLQLQEDQKCSGKPTEEGEIKKRRSAVDLTAQPPSKRRLLEEFDRTIDGPKGSGLHPVKSCQNALLDRGVFKYRASLHPNITKPQRDAKSFVDVSLQKTTQAQRLHQGDGRSAPSKIPAFVPPFIKSTTRDITNNTEAKNRKRAPAFVPPFKKQRIISHRSSPKQQEENEQHHSLLLESNSNIARPLANQTQSSTDVMPPISFSNTEMMNNLTVPVNVAPVSSTEMSPVDDMLSKSQDMTVNIELAWDMQEMRIRKKKRQIIQPLPGSLFLAKTSGVARIPLKVAVNGKPPARYSAQELYERGVHKHVPEVTIGNAESFRFDLLKFVKQEALADEGGVYLADGGWLVPSNDWTAGKKEFYRALCDTSGVDPKLISEQWVYNHYRWIVWKQASMEKSFPETMGSLCLTPQQVLLQLKYRYDVEVDNSRRPALRKIMERDDTPAKTLILCVCEIVSRGHSLNALTCSDAKAAQSAETKAESQFAVICLTDGWYAIKAQLDEPLTAMLHKGRIAVGGKLIVHGAQLIGSQDACSPLEAPDSLMLKICANSTRRARWDAKLGFHRDPRPFLLPISCLYSNGGPVGCVDIIVLRSYPMQWMERKSDGSVVFRSTRAEEREARRFNSHKQKAIEALFAKVQAEFEKEEEGRSSKLHSQQRRRRTISKQDITNLQDGEELYEAVGDDPAYMEAHLSEQQLETLQAYRRSLMEKKQAELQERYRRALDTENSEMSCPKRDVTPVWRLCIADSTVQSACVFQLNLWRPSSDLQLLLKEGCRFKAYNLVASDGKKRSSVETVQLTGTKKTQFQELQASKEWLSSCFQKRVSTDFVELQNEEFKPLCGEVDLTGYIISVVDQQGSSPAFYLADGKLNFVKVRCFSSLSQAGLEDVVKPRVLLALSNLQLRGQSIYPTPVVYAGDLTAFSTNPKEVHLKESLNQLKKLVQAQDGFFLTAEEKLAGLVKSNGINSVCSPSPHLQTPLSSANQRQDSKVTSQKPVKSIGSFTPVSSNLPAATSSTEKDQKSLKRKRALDYLSRIPSPPPISPLGSVVSPCINKTFNPPRRSGPPSTLKPVRTAAPKTATSLVEDEWVNDEELAMIDTQVLRVGKLS